MHDSWGCWYQLHLVKELGSQGHEIPASFVGKIECSGKSVDRSGQQAWQWTRREQALRVTAAQQGQLQVGLRAAALPLCRQAGPGCPAGSQLTQTDHVHHCSQAVLGHEAIAFAVIHLLSFKSTRTCWTSSSTSLCKHLCGERHGWQEALGCWCGY